MAKTVAKTIATTAATTAETTAEVKVAHLPAKPRDRPLARLSPLSGSPLMAAAFAPIERNIEFS
jgi:hypothetical protein